MATKKELQDRIAHATPALDKVHRALSRLHKMHNMPSCDNPDCVRCDVISDLEFAEQSLRIVTNCYE